MDLDISFHFQYEAIKSKIKKVEKQSINLETVFTSERDFEECRVKGLDVLGCNVYVWFSSGRPRVKLVPKENPALKIDVTPTVADTQWYLKLIEIAHEKENANDLC